MKNTKKIGLLCFSLFGVLALLAGTIAWGQANRATITGTVTDSTGAVVAGAEVTATNTETNVPAKSVSNGDGIYVIPNLFPGHYSIEFTRSGFETYLRTGMTLNSTEVARIDAALKVGTANESVTVTSDAPILDMETATIGTNMKGDVVKQLPLSIYDGGRFIEDFAVAITPGYSVVSSPYGAVVNGGQWFTKDFTVDGTSGTSNIRGDSMESGPSMEAVEEVQAETSGLDVQSSITGGGVMAFNLKSGTNSLHGSAFTYGLNEILDANTWTNDNLGTPKAKDRGWDYGFSLGGPVRHNKTFFFGTFERFDRTDYRLNSGGATVPTAAFLTGDFSTLMGDPLWNNNGSIYPCTSGCAGTPLMVQNDAGQSLQARVDMIYDPTTGNQFTNNIIPSGQISPLAQKFNSYYSNYAPNLGGIYNNERTLLAGTPTQTPVWYVVKLDHVLSEKDRLTGSWIYDHNPRYQADSGGVWESGTTTGGPLSNLRKQFFTEQQYRLSESHTFGPNKLNVLNFTDAFDDNGSVPADPNNWNSQVGIGNTGADTFPEISFSDNQAGIGETYIGNTWQGDVAGATITTGDTFTWSKGRHNLSFGGTFVAHEVDSRTGSGAYSFDFSYLNTSGPGYPYDGFGFASYELGLVHTASDTVPYNLYGRQKDISLFAQDNYKVTPKLTVNLGLRWGYNTRFHEKNGNWANFDQTAISPIYGVPGSLVFAKNGSDSFEKNEYDNNYGPSLGIAWQFLPNVVVRASYGLIFNPVGVTFFSGVPDGFAPQLGTNSANNFNWTTNSGAFNYPGVFTKATSSTDPSFMTPFPVSVDPRSLRLGYSEAFNFGVQQQLTPNMRLEISYVGNRGHRLTDTALAWNESSTATFLNLVDSNPATAANGYQSINPYNDYIYCPAAAGPSAATYGAPCPYAGFYGPAMAAIAPMPQMANAEATYWYYANLQYAGLPLGQSFYDSLVVDVVKRTGRGLAMDLSYDWSRQEGDSYSAEQEGNGFYTGVEDFQNMRAAAHALTSYDLPQVVKGFVTYELPFGKGKLWLANQGPVVNTLVNGWTIGTLLNYYTGQPFRVGAADPYWPLWGNIYPEFNVTNFKGTSSPGKYVPVPSSGQVPAQNYYMPSTVASNPPVGVLPPSPTNSRLRCPGQASENSTFQKMNHVGPDGKYNLSVRLDFYNLFNRHYYNINGCSGTSASIGSATFGEIMGVQDDPRGGQFAIRLDF